MKYITKKLEFSNQTLEEMTLNSKKFYNLIQKRRSVRDFKKDIIDFTIIKNAEDAIKNGKNQILSFPIKNTDRTVGAILSNEISKKYGAYGLQNNILKINFKGTAGQSFGAFSVSGLLMRVTGTANDYFGKGLSGATLIIKVPEEATFIPHENVIVGNVSLYGATKGEAYINGIAGERFCVRNSGAKAVVEGSGDHGCEYMTGGTSVILGPTGRNFAAGMSGGVAYVYNVDGKFEGHCNKELVDFDPLDSDDLKELRRLVQNHYDNTNSDVAQDILVNWDSKIKDFIKVMPRDYKKVLLRKKVESLKADKKEVTHG